MYVNLMFLLTYIKRMFHTLGDRPKGEAIVLADPERSGRREICRNHTARQAGGNSHAVSGRGHGRKGTRINRIVALMRRGLPIGGKRFTRNEMHEP